MQKKVCKRLGVQLELYDDNEKANLLSVYVHAIQGNSKKDMGIHITAIDRLDKAK